jgi:23S rRNA (guanosine2251-2'-O)-methyltransferase
MKVAVLDNIRSVYNVGSIFRTCNAVGIEKVVLCGITPTPLDKKGHRRSDFAKVALGAEDRICWEHVETTKEALERLKEDGFHVIAIEQDERSVDYKTVFLEDKEYLAFVIGAEVDGMSKDTLDLCDAVVEIPMLGTKESLNVTIAFGIAVYRILGV